ncbi:hypothetical protein V1509DRAFT_637068 [Lipomyces kononenkoae]
MATEEDLHAVTAYYLNVRRRYLQRLGDVSLDDTLAELVLAVRGLDAKIDRKIDRKIDQLDRKLESNLGDLGRLVNSQTEMIGVLVQSQVSGQQTTNRNAGPTKTASKEIITYAFVVRSLADITRLNAGQAREFAAGHGLSEVRTAAATKSWLGVELGFVLEE